MLAGTTLVAGEGMAVVFATGMRTEFGKIARLTQSAAAVLSPLQQEIRRLSRWIAALATGLGVVFFAVGVALGLPFWANFSFAIGIIVANVPEGLLPTVTLALAMATQRMARRNATRWSATCRRSRPWVPPPFLTDKTGTLTCNRMAARRLYLLNDRVGDDALPGDTECDLDQLAGSAGLVGLEDPPRLEVPDAVRRCREAGIRVIMCTGDHPHTALAIAREIGLVQGSDARVVTGDELRHLLPAQLQLLLDQLQLIFARVGADQKLAIVQALKAKNEVVAVTEDGVNDAPALRSAHIGTAGLSWPVWLFALPFPFVMVALEEARKALLRRRKR